MQYVIVKFDRNPFAFKAETIIAINTAKTIPQCIIYVNDTDMAGRLQNYLERHDLITSVMHGAMGAVERNDTMNAFREGNIRILIATDLIARGIDSTNVMLVINFDLPRVSKYVEKDGINELGVDHAKISEYAHRIGRTGRAGRKGVALNLVATPREKTWLEMIEKFYDVSCEDLPEDLDSLF